MLRFWIFFKAKKKNGDMSHPKFCNSNLYKIITLNLLKLPFFDRKSKNKMWQISFFSKLQKTGSSKAGIW
jgi:hypothetical protein